MVKWFRSPFGDDEDRVAIKKTESMTYFSAWHCIPHGIRREKEFWWVYRHMGRWPTWIHSKIQAVIQAPAIQRKDWRFYLSRWFRSLEAAKPVQMSKRAGEFGTQKEVDWLSWRRYGQSLYSLRGAWQPSRIWPRGCAQSAENPVLCAVCNSYKQIFSCKGAGINIEKPDDAGSQSLSSSWGEQG